MKIIEAIFSFLKKFKNYFNGLIFFFAGRKYQKKVSELDAAKQSLERIKKITVLRKKYESEKQQIHKKWDDRLADSDKLYNVQQESKDN